MSHCAETWKRLNEQAALDYEQRTGQPSGYWPAHLDGVAVTLDDAGRVVWPERPARKDMGAKFHPRYWVGEQGYNTLAEAERAADQYETFGYALAMRVLQSELYLQLDDRERAKCDALIYRGQKDQPGE